MTFDPAAIQARFQEGFLCHQKGQLAEARQIYDEILAQTHVHFDTLHFAGVLAAQTGDFARAVDLIGQALALDPDNAGAHYNLGLAFGGLGRVQDALASYERALALNPNHPAAHNNSGAALQALGRPEAALAAYDRALALKPDLIDAHFNRAKILRGLGRLEESVIAYDHVLALNPNLADAHLHRGTALLDLKRPAEALTVLDRAATLKPGVVDVVFARGNALRRLGRLDEALSVFGEALALKPDFAEVYNELGLVLSDLGRDQDALGNLAEALRLRPDFAEAHANRGVVLRKMGRFQESVDSYDRAIALHPDKAGLHNNRGAVLADLRRFDDAIASYDRAIALKPDYAEAHNNRAAAMTSVMRYDQAVEGYRQAIRFRPDLAQAHSNLAYALIELKRHDEAIPAYNDALKYNPHQDFAYGMRLHARMFICDWKPYEQELKTLAAKIRRGEKASPPFPTVTLVDDPALQRKAAEIWTRDQYPASALLGPIAARPFGKADKIRIGYFSADFRNHPVSLLLAGVIEKHDRDRFEVCAFSFGPDTGDNMRQRLTKSFDKFFDVRGKSDAEIAAMARAEGIDIAVDLGGYTAGTRTNIFALRAAPIQVNYLGYPGTMGADYIDYIIADETIIPAEHRVHYAEKVVWLPDTYQPNDASRRIAEKRSSRAEEGLPEKGVVYASFNNNYKISPGTFDAWIRILKQVEGSVLWLFKESVSAAENLRKEAERRGVNGARILFTFRTGFPEHLARHALADLFLDTLPFNAHTTCSDALWAGLPVLTCVGEGFAGRVAAGILKAASLPELVTHSRQEYRDLAIALGNDPARLAALKDKVARCRLSSPLFDVARFTRHIESAFEVMHARYRAGQAPDHIVVAS